MDIEDRIKEYRTKSEQFYNAYMKCLGAIEALQSFNKEKEELENSKK